MAKKVAKKPAMDIKAEITQLKSARADAGAAVESKAREVQNIINANAAAIVSTLIQSQAGTVRIIKHEKRFVFEFSFAAHITKRPDVVQFLADALDFARAADLPAPIQSEDN